VTGAIHGVGIGNRLVRASEVVSDKVITACEFLACAKTVTKVRVGIINAWRRTEIRTFLVD
jgi:hypothetical protein